ncbi:MAG: TGS domain-containing protein [Candidatus Eisenbacteria bacterium]|nr:TGS domain-containing protein [Candidatus Eisenbacteria bacterium]
MPANLTPEYLQLDAKLRETRDPQEKLEIMRQMLRVIPKHKGTDKMQGDLRRRISRMEDALAQKRKKGGRDPFHVPREGAGQVLLAGAPNAGKSSLLSHLTNATPQVANYPYTTHAPTPGMVPFEDVQIQLLDVPPLSREYTEAALFNAYRICDLVLFVVDLSSADPTGELLDLMAMLEEHLVRISPDPARERAGQVSEVEKRCVIVGNKMDQAPAEAGASLRKAFGDDYPVLIGSAETGEGLAELPRVLFEALRLVRVYTKKPGRKFEKSAPFVVPAGSTVMEVAEAIHKEFAENLKFARLWGSGKHQGLSVPRDHVVQDGDLLELHIS